MNYKLFALQLDFGVQTLFLLLTLTFVMYAKMDAGIPLMFLLPVIGVWQFSAAILHSLFSTFSNRKNYLIISALTLITFYVGMTKYYSFFDLELALFFPAGIAIWYYKITYEELASLKALPNSSEN